MTPRRLWIVPFVSTLDRFAMPPMLIAISRDLGLPLAQVVNAIGAYVLAYGLLQPVWGILSDRFGLVPTLRAALAVSGVTTMVSALAGDAASLAVARGLAGAFFSAAIPACLVYVGDTVAAGLRQREITRLMSGVAAGTALACGAGGLLAQYGSWRAAFLATGLAALALAVAVGGLPAPPRRAEPGLLAPLVALGRSGWAALVLCLAFVEGLVLLGVLTLLPSAIEASGVDASIAGTVTALYGVAVFVCAPLAGRLSRRLHASRLIGLGAAGAVAGCGLIALRPSVVTASVAAVLIGAAWAFMHSSLQTWATEVLPRARAAVVSAFAGCLFLGGALAAVLAGPLAQADRYAEIFGWAALLAIPLGLTATLGRRRWTRPEGEPSGNK
ncbi:MFS transporter [Nonomuraea sp. NPDC050663]|uniref:MFS transporter n=1 Tax=Nonomuraea sp. NPDC050663 TaxID=3364370 RepID=UPI00379F3291